MNGPRDHGPQDPDRPPAGPQDPDRLATDPDDPGQRPAGSYDPDRSATGQDAPDRRPAGSQGPDRSANGPDDPDRRPVGPQGPDWSATGPYDPDRRSASSYGPDRFAAGPDDLDRRPVGPQGPDRSATGPQEPLRSSDSPYDPDRPPTGPYGAFRPVDDPHGADDPDGGAGDRRDLTATEDLLVRALAARAGQLTHHSLRPASPPAPNWAARGRGPLVLALAASVASVALVGTAAVSLLQGPDQAGVADTPPAQVSAPPSLTPTPSATPSTRPGATASTSTSPSAKAGTTTTTTPPSAPAGGAAPPSVEQESTPPSRTVTIVYGDMGETTVLRTGGDGTTFLATVYNTLGRPAENTTDMLTVTVDGGSGALRPGDVSVSLLDGGDWRAVGSTGSSGVEARLTGPDTEALGDGQERVHEVRVSLGESFPEGVTRLRIDVFSDAGGETLDLKG